ncbi:glycosyltransferase [Litorihabitans aurantiacus]|uniref:glycosyltransferase n=1 Tax=Litorihabitans aurantiacus TaxID=1930061 RepID=UPI0024E0FE02|nr:glycosyltransferase [Litorihabitans aurantiacus]
MLERDDDVRTDHRGAVRDPHDAGTSAPTAGGALHWAPLHHPGHTGRFAAITAEIAADPPDAFVVDVSVEVTLLVRLLGVPVVVMTQPGARDDDPHRLAWRIADAVVAPWPAGRYDPLGRDLHEVGGISRFDGRPRAGAPVPGRVLVLGGGAADEGTGTDDPDGVPGAGSTTWHHLGGHAPWAEDPWPAICAAEVVVSAAGQNAVADLAAAGARAIVVAQDRPFDEQRATAEALGRAGLAVVVPAWPSRDEWPGLLQRARALDPDWSRWRVAGAAARAADVIAAVAARATPAAVPTPASGGAA